MPDKTLEEASKELHSAIVGLRNFVEREFPKRVEIHRDFVKKEASRNRFVFVLFAVLISAIFNLFCSVALVSTCFLSSDDRPGICNMMPGFEAAQERNEKIIAEFRRLQKVTIQNEARISELERQNP